MYVVGVRQLTKVGTNKPQAWVVTAQTWQGFYNNFQGPVTVWDKAAFNPSRDYLFPIKSEEAMISGIVQTRMVDEF